MMAKNDETVHGFGIRLFIDNLKCNRCGKCVNNFPQYFYVKSKRVRIKVDPHFSENYARIRIIQNVCPEDAIKETGKPQDKKGYGFGFTRY